MSSFSSLDGRLPYSMRKKLTIQPERVLDDSSHFILFILRSIVDDNSSETSNSSFDKAALVYLNMTIF